MHVNHAYEQDIHYTTALYRMLEDPADSCLTCGREVDKRHELRLVAQVTCGVALSDEIITKFAARPAYTGHIKVLNTPEAYLTVWGTTPLWNSKVLDEAARLIRQGKRPWYCYVCGDHLCKACGTLFKLPYRADYISQNRSIGCVYRKNEESICLNEGCCNYELPDIGCGFFNKRYFED